MTAGEKMRNLREAKNETIAVAAGNMNINPSTYAMYERDERTPKDATKVTIASYLGSSIMDIFFEN